MFYINITVFEALYCLISRYMIFVSRRIMSTVQTDLIIRNNHRFNQMISYPRNYFLFSSSLLRKEIENSIYLET